MIDLSAVPSSNGSPEDPIAVSGSRPASPTARKADATAIGALRSASERRVAFSGKDTKIPPSPEPEDASEPLDGDRSSGGGGSKGSAVGDSYQLPIARPVDLTDVNRRNTSTTYSLRVIIYAVSLVALKLFLNLIFSSGTSTLLAFGILITILARAQKKEQPSPPPRPPNYSITDLS